MKTGKQLGFEPANPTLEIWQYTNDCPFDSRTYNGLTKREYFAGLAMKGLIIDYASNVNEDAPRIANEAVLYADALLEELSK